MMFRIPEIIIRIAETMRVQDGKVLMVGGSVRDMLLGLPPKDFDLEVYGIEPQHLEVMLSSLGPDWIDTVGASFGVMKVLFGEVEIDISVPRRDSKTGAGHKGFRVVGDPTMSPKEAARRRDLTINALAMDPLNGEILDFFGGLEDLDKRILRATDAERFCDDPLRVLRVAQFASRLGFRVEADTLTICRKMVCESEFAELPSARIGEEWRKLLLKSPRPSVGLKVGLDTGAWQVLHPELTSLVGCIQDSEWHPEGDVWQHALMAVDVAAEIVRREELEGEDALVVLLGALCHDLGKPATTEFIEGHWRAHGHEMAGIALAYSFLARMEFGKRIEERVIPIVANHMFPPRGGMEASDATIGRLSRRLAPATIRELVWVSEADVRGRGVVERDLTSLSSLLKRAEEMEVLSSQPKPILMGRHLMSKLGWKPGPYFGPVLEAVFDAQIEGQVTTLVEALEMASSREAQ